MRRVTLLAAVAGALSLSSPAFATDVVYGCIKMSNPNKGSLRIVDAAGSCGQNELAVQLLASLPRLSCATGSTLFSGVCIENTARAAMNHSDAGSACASVGRRLPSGGELTGFREVPGIQFASGGEWTDDLGDIATSSTFKYFIVGQRGNGVGQAFDAYGFRCVGSPQVE